MDLQALSLSVTAEHPNIYQPSIPTREVRRVAARRAPSGRLGVIEGSPTVARAEDSPTRRLDDRGSAAAGADGVERVNARRSDGEGGNDAGASAGGGRRRRRVVLPDSASATDLRRVRGGSMAMFIDTIVTRATQLPAADRQLLLSVYRDGQSVTSIALAACAGNEEACRVAARRGAIEHRGALNDANDAGDARASRGGGGDGDDRDEGGAGDERGGARVSSPAALLARALRRRVRLLAARLMEPKFVFVMREMRDWPTARRAVAEAVVLHGLSLREAAAALSMSLHAVRREHAAVHALFTARGG